MTETEKNALRIRAAKILGIKPKTECPECYGSGYTGSEQDHYPCDDCKTTGRVKPYYVSPDYPNDLNACAELLRKVVEVGWHVDMYGNGASWSCLFGKDGACYSGQSEELATAICLAFVATMEEKQ